MNLNLPNLLFALLAVGSGCAEPAPENPFAPGRAPSEVVEAAWERLIVTPKTYTDTVIALDGWLGVSVDGDILTLRIYKSSEAQAKARAQSHVELKFDSSLVLAYRKGNLVDWKKLSGRYVVIWGKYEGLPDDVVGKIEELGYLQGPHRLYFPPSNNQRLKAVTIEPENARWEDRK